MKKINEIVKTVPQIVEGVKNSIVKNNETEMLSKQRIEICGVCEKYNSNAKRCNVCGCFMEFKTRSKDAKCPLGKW